jgi:galactokinase
VTQLEERLRRPGLTGGETRSKLGLFSDVEAALRALGGSEREILRWFVPGRIEILGKHTDYAGGRSLLCAVGRGFCVAASPRTDRIVRVADAARGETVEVALVSDLTPASPGWKRYVETVASRVVRNFPGNLRGADIALASDLPRAAGLSSSSALVVSLFTALSAINALERHPAYAENIRNAEDLGEYLGCLENGRGFRTLSGDRGAGIFGGSEDQTAILCCRAGEIAQYAFCPVRHERSIPLPDDWTFVVASSGVPSDKTGAVKERYNRLSLASSAILKLWNRSAKRSDSSLYAAATCLPGSGERIRELLRAHPAPEFEPGFLLRRFDQFVEESAVLIPAVAERLAGEDIPSIGELVDRSQELAERCLQNQIPQTIRLVREARRLGASAASAFGGGFGGSVWALVRSEEAESFLSRWAESYAGAFPSLTEPSRFFPSRPGPPMVRL